MRKLAISVALATTALASPAMARDNQWYVGVDGGAMIVEDMSLDIGAIKDAANLNSDTGYDVGGVVGYDFGGFRLESEVSYRSADAKSLSATGAGIPGNTPGTFTGAFPTGGTTSALGFMVNGLLDFGDDDGLQGFVGGGAGVARIDVQNSTAGATSPWLDDSDTGFAWQALAGIRAPLSNNWDVGLKYRFFNAPKVNLVDRVGRAVDTRFRSHSIMGSLIYNFGGPAAPVEVAAPPPPPYVAPEAPPPPPPPPAVTCNSGPYIVFFDWDKSDLTSQGASTLDQAVSNYGSCGNARVMLAGHADRSGAASYNVGLSQRRNSTVRAYMESKGVGTGAISTEALGESQNLVATADGVREPQNRRVEVSYGPGSGN